MSRHADLFHTDAGARDDGVVERSRLEMSRNALPPINDKLILLLLLD